MEPKEYRESFISLLEEKTGIDLIKCDKEKVKEIYSYQNQGTEINQAVKQFIKKYELIEKKCM